MRVKNDKTKLEWQPISKLPLSLTVRWTGYVYFDFSEAMRDIRAELDVLRWRRRVNKPERPRF